MHPHDAHPQVAILVQARGMGPLPDRFLIEEYMPEWPIWVRVFTSGRRNAVMSKSAFDASAGKSNFDNTKVSGESCNPDH
jgi:hypothetical protein